MAYLNKRSEAKALQILAFLTLKLKHFHHFVFLFLVGLHYSQAPHGSKVEMLVAPDSFGSSPR